MVTTSELIFSFPMSHLFSRETKLSATKVLPLFLLSTLFEMSENFQGFKKINKTTKSKAS